VKSVKAIKEDKKEDASSASPGSLSQRLFRWLDKRTGVNELMKESLDEPIPGGARLAYVFGSGLIFIFISQIITGICLAIYYVPSAETAHTSVAYISKQVAAGAFLRSLHYYGSSAMIIVLALHFLQTFLYGSFKGRRELLWISGAVLSLLVLGMGFTGYLLPWDQKAYFATAVGTNIVGQVPLIGNWLTRLLRGGDTIGTLTLSRFYVAHVFLIPGAIFAFIAVHIALFRKAGPAGPINEDPIEPKLPAEGFYPRQVLMDMAFALLLMIGLGILSFFHPATLGPLANPADTQFLPRPEWYYLPMFEWLKYWEGPKVVFAVVVVPGLLAAAFFLLPFLDRKLERRPWRRPIPVLAVAFVVLGMIYMGAKSRMDDARDPSAAAQIAIQDKQEKAYSVAPFVPYVESPGGTIPAGPVNPVVAQGRGIFESHGCSGCHGDAGVGGRVAPTLVSITQKIPEAQLAGLLHNPNAAMRAGKMPAVDISSPDMTALIAYLAALGTSAANVPAVYRVSPAEPGVKEASLQPAGRPLVHLTTAALAGRQLYQERGCFACHGQAGEGGRAPAMAPLIVGASETKLIALLKNPDAKMKAGGMPPFAGTAAQMSSVIAYLRTLSAPQAAPVAAVETAATEIAAPAEPVAPVAAPVEPTAAPAPASAPAVVAVSTLPSPGRAIFLSQGCAACHGPAASGTHFAPSLIGVGAKFPGNQLPNLLRHPTAKMRNGGMPTPTVNDAQLHDLVAYLSGLSSAAAAQTVHPAIANAGAAMTPGAPVSTSPNAQVAAPPKPVALSPQALRGQQIFERATCQNCHGIGGLSGTVAAPGLAGTASILTANVLENLLRHHSIRMQQGGMPLTNMKTEDLRALVAYIRSMPSPGGGN
jgi:ubiquinol-cytochrome c reductase cytochrome b subunit